MSNPALGHYVTMKPSSLNQSSGVRRGIRIFFLTITCLLLAATTLPALHGQTPNDRKVLVRVQPKYPEYLRIHEIGGAVRLLVEITPHGTVKSVTPVGGNPILVEAATDAVKQWKYEPADTTNKVEVKIDFVPGQK
jgi:TonB family protein